MPLSPKISHVVNTNSAITITIGIKIKDTLSARREILAFELEAASTSLIIWDKLVSFPTFKALASIVPSVLIVPCEIISPTVLSLGIDSPVNIDSSSELDPLMISPSTGTASPGRTTKISPTTTSLKSTLISTLSLITLAFLGAKLIKALIALVVFPFDILSNVLPTVINVGTIPLVSKNIFIDNLCRTIGLL